MIVVIGLVVLLLVLHQRGRLGPLEWAGRPVVAHAHNHFLASGSGAGTASAEQVLAQRLADGDLAPDEYLERMSALRDR